MRCSLRLTNSWTASTSEEYAKKRADTVVHHRDLLDRLDALPKESFSGDVFRATRQNLDPLASLYSCGRWMRRDGAGVLYTSLAREGALAEISVHWES